MAEHSRTTNLSLDGFVTNVKGIAALATAGNLTYTAAQVLSGFINRDPAGGARSDVTPTAAEIVGAIDNCMIGDSVMLTIRNAADAAETITVTAGTNVTLTGTMTIAQNYLREFLVTVTAVTTPAVTFLTLGTFAHNT